MPEALTQAVLEDELAITLARVVAVANRRARELGVDLGNSLVTVTEQMIAGDLLWRVNYGPRDYVNRRGGDLIVDVDAAGPTVTAVRRGQ